MANIKLTLPKVRGSFLDLFEAKDYKNDKKFKFKATFLMPKGSPNAQKVEQAIQELAKEEWKGSAEKTLKQIENNPQKYCFRDGDLKDYDGYAGHMALSASNKFRTDVLHNERGDDGKFIKLTAQDNVVYSGCYLNVILEIYTYEGGIYSKLLGTQFHSQGDAFSGGQVATDEDFEDLSDGADAPATSAGSSFV